MRRIIAMLLAIVLLVGNVPVQAFAAEGETPEAAACATEGCAYEAGHEGNCSNYAAPEEPEETEPEKDTAAGCATEGCTYAAGHEGNCSNYVEPAADAVVYVTVSNRGEVGMAHEEVTVSDRNSDGKLTVDEALYAAHVVYGKGYASENGTVTKLWGVATTNVSFFINHKAASTDVSTDQVRAGDYLVASVDQDTANDYDKYSRFDVLEKYVSGGESFTLTLTDDNGTALAGMEIGLSNGRGSTTMLGQYTDENGCVTLTFDQGGLYCVTAKGTVVEQRYDLNTQKFTAIETPIIAPVCTVVVTGEASVWSSTGDSEGVAADVSEQESSSIVIETGDVATGTYVRATKITIGAAGSVSANTISEDGNATVLLTEEQESVEITLDLAAATKVAIKRAYVAVDDGTPEIASNIDETAFTAAYTATVTPGWVNNEAVVKFSVGFYMSELKNPKDYTLTLKKSSGGSAPTEVKVTGVTLDQATAEVKTGETSTLTATVLPADATNQNVTWSSDKEEMATVSNGVVTAVSAGTATITVTTEDGSFTAECVVTVPEEQKEDSSSVIEIETGDTWSGAFEVRATKITIGAAGSVAANTTKDDGNATVLLTGDPASLEITLDLTAKNKIIINNAYVAVDDGTPEIAQTIDETAVTAAYTTTVTPEWDDNGEMTIKFTVGFYQKSELKYTKDYTLTLKKVSSSEPDLDEEAVFDLSTGDTSSNLFGIPAMISAGISNIRVNANGEGSAANYTAGSASWTGNLTVSAPVPEPLTFTLTIIGTSYNYAKGATVSCNGGEATAVTENGDGATCSWSADITPEWNENGEATVTFDVTYNKTKTYTLNLKKIESSGNQAPTLVGNSAATADITQFDLYALDLGAIFEDDNDSAAYLTYLVRIDGGTATQIAQNYQYVPTTAGTHKLVFTAKDTLGESSNAYTLTLNTAQYQAQGGLVIGNVTEQGGVKAVRIQKTDGTTINAEFDFDADAKAITVYLPGDEVSGDETVNAVFDLLQVNDLPFLSKRYEGFFARSESTDTFSTTLSAYSGTATAYYWTEEPSFQENRTCYTITYQKLVDDNHAPGLADGVQAEVSETIKQYQTWSVDLSKIFTEPDGEAMTYTVSVNGGKAQTASASYSYECSTAGSYTFVFTATEPAGLTATYTVNLTVTAVPRTLVSTGIKKAEADGVFCSGIQVTGYALDSRVTHYAADQHKITFLMTDAPDDASVELAFQDYWAYYQISYYANESEAVTLQTSEKVNDSHTLTLTLANGAKTLNLATTTAAKNERQDYQLIFRNWNNAPVPAAGYSDTCTVQVAYVVELDGKFTDQDNDPLDYYVSVDDGEKQMLDSASYTYTAGTAGEHTLVFTVSDGFTDSEAYTVTLTAEDSAEVYDVSVMAPAGVALAFYGTSSFDGVNGDVPGDTITAEAGETADGWTAYTVKVPENISQISIRGTTDEGTVSWGGMSLTTKDAEGNAITGPVYLRQFKGIVDAQIEGNTPTTADVQFAVQGADDNYAVSGSTVVEDGCLTYRFLLVAERDYTFYTMVSDDLASTYTTKTAKEAYTVTKDTTVDSYRLGLALLYAVEITVPDGSIVQIGKMSNYYKYYFYEEYYLKETNSDGTVTYTFAYPADKNPDGTTGGSGFIRVQHPDGVTYWDYQWDYPKGKKSAQLTITADDLFINSSEFAPKTIYHDFSQNRTDVGDIYLSVNNKQGCINMSAGETYKLNVYRNWQAIEGFGNGMTALPDVHYTVIDANGNPSDLLSVTTDQYNSSQAEIRANGTGTAIVLVTYDAMFTTALCSDALGYNSKPTKVSAIWPENTGVVVVTVGADGTGIQTNMDTDPEHDPIYYLGSQGAEFSFTPEAGCTVSVARAIVGTNSLTYNGFTTDGVNVNTETGEVTITGLTQGRHIIRVEKGGVANYQVVTTKQTTLTITDENGNAVTDTTYVEPGTTLTFQFGDLYNPVNKLAGIYNSNCAVQYAGEDGTKFTGSNGETVFGYYVFAATADLHKVTVTVPSDWTKETYTLEGSFSIGGFGGSGGAHRGLLLYETGRASNNDADSVSGNPGVLPTVTLNILLPEDKASLEENQAAVSSAKSVIETVESWTVDMATANDIDTVKAWIKAELDKLELGEVNADVTVTACMPAAAGTVEDEDGTDGSFAFSIELYKGTGANKVTDTLSDMTGTITATNFNGLTFAVTLPSGSGYTVAAAEGSASPVKAKGSYSFTLTVSDKYYTTEEFAVKANGETLEAQNGVYTIENICEDMTVTITGIVRVPNLDGTALVYFSASHDAGFLKAEKSGAVMGLKQIEVPWFDLALYGLDAFTYERGEVTMLHLYIYATEVYYCGIDASEAGKGYLKTQNILGTDVLAFSGNSGSLFTEKFWGYDSNLNYYHNYQYPVYEGTTTGATADRIILSDGDIITLGHFTSYAFFNDPSSIFNYIALGDSTVVASVAQDQQATLSVYRAGADLGTGGGTNSPVELEQAIYYVKADAAASGDVTTWAKLGTTDEKGQLVLDASELEVGTYILAVPGRSGTTNLAAICSAPGGIVLNVLDASEADKIQNVIDLIEKIGEDITLESETAINAAREAYNALTDEQKAGVTNLSKLTAAEAALEKLKNPENTEDRQAADAVINLIKKIGDPITADSRTDIEAARAAYDGLTAVQKEMVTNYDELAAAEKVLQMLESLGTDVANIYQTTGDYLAKKELGFGSITGEWAALGLARSGREVADSYYAAVAAAVNADRLHANKSTDNSRVILALTAIGKDVTNVNGHNLLAGLNEMSYIQEQGVNGPIWALIALDSDSHAPCGDVTREKLVQAILDAQLSAGGWALSGAKADADVTGMALQALAPYYASNNSVKAAVDSAVTVLSEMQNVDGTFGSIDGSSSESCAQVIVALTALGIDPGTDSRFIKNGISVLDALCSYYVEGGGFEHVASLGLNEMATEQGYYALVSYYRFKNNQSRLYDMTDDKAAAESVVGKINAIGTVTENSGAAITEARSAYNALTPAQKNRVTNYSTLTAAEAEYAALTKTAADEAAANAVEEKIAAIGTVTLSSEGLISAARSAYNALTTTQKNLVENYSVLTVAEERLQYLKDAQAANAVEDLISAIGSSITLGSESKINTARNAYNALTSTQKNMVSNYQTLVNAEEALKALKSTASVTFTLLGCYKHGSSETSVHTLASGNLQTWIAAKTYKIAPGDTVKDVFEEALTAAGLGWSNPTGNYVESITYQGVVIGEFTNGKLSGWMYTLNGKHPNLGVQQQTLVDGDVIVFHYTDDYTKEEGSEKYNTSTSTSTASDTAAAEAVDRLIEDIGEEITLDSEAKILAARAAYDKLTETQKKLVEEYDELVAAEAALAELKKGTGEDIYITTGDYLAQLGTPGVGSIGGEWMVIGLARSGRAVPIGYYDHVIEYVRNNINEHEQLHSAKSTDNSRVILALTAIGRDVTNVDGHNLLTGLNSMDHIQKQGINGPIWALIALDSGNYPVPEGDVSREKLIDVILEAQLSDGGWALSGEVSDPDMTGMAVQALAPYLETNPKVKAALEDAVWAMSEMQNDNGSYSSVDGASSESIAQIIVALAALGIDADSDARFVKNGISALDALLTYYVPGGFRHVLDGNLDGMATEQGYYTLTAYYRMKDNQNFLYDMTDVIDAGGDVIVEETVEPTEPVEEEETNGASVVLWVSVMVLCAGAAAAILLGKKKIFGK